MLCTAVVYQPQSADKPPGPSPNLPTHNTTTPPNTPHHPHPPLLPTHHQVYLKFEDRYRTNRGDPVMSSIVKTVETVFAALKVGASTG